MQAGRKAVGVLHDWILINAESSSVAGLSFIIKMGEDR
jgi:hypothetical protein